MKAWHVFVCAFWILQAAHAAGSNDLEARETALAHQLRCVVCQNQTVAESQAPIAKDMRAEIVKQLAQGHSDAEVIEFFEQRYGSFVRYTPPWRPSTWLLWCLPFVVLLGGFAVLFRSLQKRAGIAATSLSDKDKQRAKVWLEGKSAEGDSEAQP